MKKIILICLLYSTCFYAKAQQKNEEVFEREAVLHGDSIVFPITLINAFPFVSGEVNGIKGKFMFDTGNPAAIDLNDNLALLPKKKKSGSGMVGSGQSFTVNMNDTISEVKFKNGYTYRNLLNIKSANYEFLQDHITPDCLGYIGYNFFKGYLFKLDYLRRKITFYKNTAQRKVSKDFLTGEKILAVLNFETRKAPNDPFLKVKIGQVSLLGTFDTGQYGLLQVEDSALKSLQDGSFVKQSGADGFDNNLLSVSHIILDGSFETNLKGVQSATLESTLPERRGTLITEPNLINFGYRFLDQYKTVWDYDEKKIYILEK